MTEFDVVHRGAVGGVRRCRRIIVAFVGAVLTGFGVAMTVTAIVQLVDEQDGNLDGTVGESTVPGGTVEFRSDGGPFTIFLLTPGLHNAAEVERQVAATVCEVQHPSGSESIIRGSRQSASTTTDDATTVGWFTAESGTTSVVCDDDRIVERSRAFAVAPGRPGGSARDVVVLGGGIVALVTGPMLFAWGWRRRAVPVAV